MVNDKYVVKYLDPRTGKYEYATIKDVGDLQKLNTKVKTSIVDAINSISTDGIGGLRDDLNAIGETIKSLEDGTLELGDFKSIDDVVSREIEDAINSLKLENSGLLQLTKEEINKIVSDAESEYRDNIATSIRELETSKTDLVAAREKMITIGKMLENANIDYSNLTQVVDSINLYITDIIEKTDFDMVNGIVSDYKTAVTQTQDGWGVDASKNMLSYLTGRVKSNETSLNVQHGLIEAKVGKDEFQYMTVDNLPAGKENMLHNTSDLRDWDFSSAFIFKSADDYRFTSIVQSDSAGENITGTTDELEQGVTYAISTYVNVQNKNKKPGQEKYAPTDGLYTATVIINGDTIELNNVVEDNSALDGWKRVSGTFIAKRTAKQDIKFYVTAFNRDTQVGYLSAPKFEKGSSATSWVPHIEDNVSTMLSQNAVMRVLSDRITSSVEEVRETKDAFETATSTFDQMADGFELNTNKLTEVLDKYGEVTGVQNQQASELKVLNESITSKVWKQDINTTIDTINIDTSNRIVNSAFNIYNYDEQTGALKLDYWDNNTGFAIKKHSQSLDNYLYAKRSNATSVNPISIKSSPFALRDGEKILFNFEYLAVGNPLDNDNVFTLEMYDNNDVRVGLQEFRLSELKKEFLTAYDVGDSYKYNGTYIVKNSSVVKGTITLKLPKNGELWLTKVMLQNAGIGTIGWTPSSVDNQIIQSKLSTEINQLADSIELVATDERLDAINGLLVKKDGKVVISPEAIISRVTSQELGENGLITQTSLKQTEDNLRFDLVDKDGVIQTINASAEGLLIDFDKVHIDGEVIARMISAQAIDVTQGFRLTDNNGNTLLAVVNDNGKPTLSITKDFRIKFGEVNDKLDVTIVGIMEEYYYSVDPDELIGGTWTSTPDVFQGGENRFVWKRTKIIYQSGDVSYYPSETGINITGSWEYEKESVTAEVVKALDSAEAAKELAVSEANQAMIDANKYAEEQDALIKQQVTTSVDTAISTAEDAKQTAIDNYNNAVTEANRLVGEQTKTFDTKFGEIEDSVDTFNQSVADVNAKADANAKLLTTHQDSLNTINDISIPNINTSISNVMSEAESALSSAGSAMDEALKTDGKIATLKESISKDVKSVSDTAASALSKANTIDTKISGVNTSISDLDTKLSNSISTTSQSLTNQINSASSKAQQALDEANKADGKISDYVTRNGLVSGTTVDSKINTATGEINQNISKVEGKIDGLQVGGRNYLKRSDLSTDAKILADGEVFDFSQDSTAVTALFSNLKLEKGKYIYHIMMKKPIGDSGASIRFHKNNVTVSYYGRTQEVDGEWNRIEIPFKVTDESDIYGSQIYNHAFGANFATTVEVMHPMIEKGSTSSDWTPAPEDNYTQEEFKIFEASYNSSVEGINSKLGTVENKVDDNGRAFTEFKENEYSRTASEAKDAFTSVNKMIDENGNATEDFSRAVYEKNSERQKASFNEATKDLVRSATYEEGIDGIKNSLSEVEGKIPTSVGGRNYLLNSGKPGALAFNSNNGNIFPITRGVENGVDWFYQSYNDDRKDFLISTYVGEYYDNKSYFGKVFSKDLEGYDGIVTYSVDVMSPEPVTIRMSMSGSGKDSKATLIPNKWTRLVATIPITDYPRPLSLIADIKDNYDIPMGTKLYWRHYKIEKGNIATDYSPAPEDTLLESDFKSFQADYEQNAQGITSRLSTAENSIKDNNQAFTTFKENEYKRTAERVSDTFTKQETTTMLGGKADASQLSNYLAKSTYERDAEQSKERFETIESDLGNISVGGRNYAYKGSIIGNSLDLFNTDDYPLIYIKPTPAAITAGIKISNTLFEVGETYTLSFTIQNLEDGEEIYHLGGHSNAFETLSVSMDGVEYSGQWNIAPIKTSLGHDEHKVIVKLKFTGMSGDSNLYIQPNRGGKEFKRYHALIKNININKGTVVTDWSPAVEDMANLSYVSSEVTKSAEAIKTSLTNYAKTTDLNGLATETYATNVAVEEAGKVSSELTKYELKTGVDSKLSTMASALRTETAEKLKTVYTKSETETLLGKKADSSTLKNYVQQATYESGIDGVSQSLSRVEGKIDGLQVGGRNLLRNSGKEVSNGNYNISRYDLTDAIKEGEEVTVTIWGSLAKTKSNFAVYNSGGSVHLAYLTDNGNGTYSNTFKWKIGSSNNTYLNVYAFTNSQTGISTINKVKLEKGNIATDWSPAPEDTLTQDEYKAFKSDYESTVEGITGQITSLSESKLDGNTYTNFLSNEYKTTAEKATSAFTKVDKVVDASGNVKDDFSKAVYEQNATRQSASFNEVTKDLVTTATYSEGVKGINQSITSIRGDLDNLSVGGRNLIQNSDFNNEIEANGNTYKEGYSFNGTSYEVRDGEFYITSPEAGNSSTVRFVYWLPGNKINVKKGDKFTLSFRGRTDSPNTLFVRGGGGVPTTSQGIPMTSSNEIHKATLEVTIESASNGAFVFWLENAGVVVFDWIKLELGSIATDYSPAPEDMLGKADFQIFKGTYETNDQAIKNRLTAIDSSEEGSVVTRLNKTESTASGNSKLITTINNSYVTQKNINESILSDKQIKDTRNDNQLPSWYMKNYPKQQVKEFKNITVMGLKTNTSGTYGVLTTDVQWGDATGGTVKQQFVTNDATYIRTGNNDGTLWEEWVTQVNTADKTYQKVIETSDMYQRVVGEGDGELVYSKNRRLGSKSQHIEKGSIAKIQHNGDGFEVGKTYTLSFDVSCLLGDVVKWVERDRTDVLPFKRITKEDKTILAKDSYIERNGVNGNVTYQWTVETVNGVETGNRTDEVIVRRVEPVDEIYVKGTNTSSTVNFTINKVEQGQTEQPKTNIVMLGDSITMGYGRNIKIPNIVSQEIERSVQNAGYGSTTAALHPSKPEIRKIGFTKLVDSITSGNWTEALNADFSGITYATPTAYKQSLTDLSKINFNDIESVIIMYGTNDWAMDVKLDNANDMYDQSTYLGALRYGVNKLQQAYPHLEILVSQPILWTMGAMNSENYNNGIGLKVKDYANALNNSLNMGTPIAQVYNRGITTSNYGQYFPSNDGTHPNDDGNSVIGKLIASEFTRVFSTDKASVVNFSISKEDSKTSTVTLNFLT